MKEKIKKISIIVLAITVVVLSIVCINLNIKYDTNTHSLNTKADSLCTVIEAQGLQYDSLKAVSDSLYQYELNKSDSLWQLLQTKQTTNKTKITYIYKDSTIIKEAENTEIATTVETKYIDRIVEKEVIKTVHDTVMVTKHDTTYNENTTQTNKETNENTKEVVVKDEFFNIYLNADVKGTLQKDIVPEADAGVIIKEKFYGQIGIDYDKGKVNPNAKIGVRFKLF